MFIQPETFIEFCYETFLQRAADIEGKRYYLEQIKLGWSFQSVIQSFLQSSEFQQHQQNSQNNQNNNEQQRKFITNLYKYLLKRNPDNSELEYWLTTSHTLPEILHIFGESAEYKQVNNFSLKKPPESLYGIMIKSDEIDGYLLYPTFDKVQLQEALQGKPFQLNDFLACMTFLENHSLFHPDKSCFLDLGANIGSTSIYALKGNYFQSAISIEASGLNHQFLTFNTQINQLTERLQALNYGLANFTGTGELVCNPDNCGDFRIQPVNVTDNLFNEDNYRRELAEFITLDELKNRGILNPRKIGFVWIDCQGSEGLIFQGGQEFFREISVPLYVEFWPYGINRLAGKKSYLSFIETFASRVWRLHEGTFVEISLDFLYTFYQENLNTGEYIDILVIPN
ncbi:hypothetical protein MiYa_01737 [Microcystis aeruginosa NIES-2519]|uniref:Methyltransferase FkbM domain-containing protein n=1 Tax=Microcystis aeruginosa NIES-2519 TaxID=2303981 RepID=A0A5A5R5X1_MICAE|nr:FkbM family methyltransferase [Microcystis aeruginosa]GCA70205.1 hypothetical protein MiYa_01737 [Microcystis aeruginosa NIES-2519]